MCMSLHPIPFTSGNQPDAVLKGTHKGKVNKTVVLLV